MTCYIYDHNHHLIASDVKIEIDRANNLLILGSTPHHMIDIEETENGYTSKFGAWYAVTDI